MARSLTEMLRSDSPPEQATALTAAERFLQSRNDPRDANCVPPLIEQAQIFASYLNPPPPPVVAAPAPKPQAKPADEATPAVSVKPPAASPKFELHGVSYYRDKPEDSMALVREPGGTRRWVRVGQQVGHLTIERIEGTSIVCRMGEQTQVLALAADEAIAQYARGIKDAPASKRPASPAPMKAHPAAQGPIVPPPAPGIRQMPHSRVAAMLGQSTREE